MGNKKLKRWSELSPFQQAFKEMFSFPSVTIEEALELNKEFFEKLRESRKEVDKKDRLAGETGE